MSSLVADRIADSIRSQRRARGAPALIPFVTAGFPTRDRFAEIVRRIAPVAAAIEVGVPYSDPMADGVTIQRTSRIALENGVTLRWILSEVAALRKELSTPIVLMGYLNPFLRFGPERLAHACAEAGVDGLIIPDLPLEEAGEFRDALHGRGVGLVQLVTPVTPKERLAKIAAASDGFLYAVTTMGTTGSDVAFARTLAYLQSAREVSPVPLCAGFGVRTPGDLRTLGEAADGVIVGSALAEAIERGEDPREWLRSLLGGR